MKKKFIRQEADRHSRIGKRRKKLQKWRRPKGRDSKMRLNMHGHAKTVSVGYKKPKKQAGKIQNLQVVLVHNRKELNDLGKNQGAILAKVGAKKKLELIKEATEKKIKILNVKGEKK
ncbi:MAG: eL32 family ribosomal protein [Nanoarchaeota archaeon]|nr:eL32 family ribosomal protein [Nanoarchaeota archaeon]MBU1103754.1 eL32 family ribosomal protein [Nanoarchaeota archaeon]